MLGAWVGWDSPLHHSGGTATLGHPPPFGPQYTFLPSPLMGRPPIAPPPFYPQILYWPYPSPPVSPPQPPSALVIMHTDPTAANLIHSVPEWGMDYLTPAHQLGTQNIGTMGMHSAAA